jgi:hypothetical protein
MRLFTDLSLKFAHREESKGLQSCELGGQISFDQWFFSGWPSARLDDFSCVARKAFSTQFDVLPAYFLAKDGLFTLLHTRDGQLSNECRKQFMSLAVA